MSIYSIIAGLLHPIPPGNWKMTDPSGASGTITRNDVRIVADNHPLQVTFDFSTSGASHTLIGNINTSGDALIKLDGTDKTDHPVIHAGLATHWEPLPVFYVLVKFRFNESGTTREYRFEGKR